MNASLVSGNNNVYVALDKEETNMIKTGKYKNYGQLEDQANGVVDVEAFVFRNGEVVPANQVQNSNTPVINTAPEKNYAR